MSTDQQQTEQALLQCQQLADELNENEAFYRSIIKSSPDCIEVLDLQGNLLSMPSGQDLLGIEDIAPFLNKSWFSFWEGNDRSAAQAALKAAVAGGCGKFVGFSRTFHGESKWWDVVVSPILGANGQPTRLLTVSRDVTDRYKAQEDLRQCTIQFEALLNEAPMGVFLITDDFCISQANPVACQVWPSSPTLIGRNFEELMRSLWPAAMADDIVKKYRHTLASGEPYRATDIADKRIDHGGNEYYEWQINRIVLADGRYGVVCYFRDISERALAQQAIDESEERYRNLFNTMDQGFCVIDVLFDAHDKAMDYRFVEVNPAFALQTGMQDATGKRMRELVPNLEEHWFDILGQVALTGEPMRFTNEAKAMGERWFDVFAFRMGGPDSSMVALLFNNISKRKRGELALRESQELYRNLFNAIDEGFCIIEMIFDAHGKAIDYYFVEVNPSFERHSGLHDVRGKRVRELLPDLEANWFEIYGQVALTGEPIRFVNELKTQNRWLDVYAARLGQPGSGQVAVVFTNITERTQAEQALRQSEARFRALFDWGPLAMYTVDAAGVIQEFNRNAVVLWGCEPKLGETSERYCGSYKMHQPDGTALQHRQSPVAAVLSGEIPAARDVEFEMERPDGSKITVIANIVPLKNSHGEITGAMNCLYDITERSRLERQTLEQAQTLLTLDRRKDEFLAMLNHELRNPIAAIFNAVNLLETAKNEAPAQLQGRSIIARQAGQLKHLVDDLLEVSRITTGTIHLRKEQVSMNSVVAHAVETTEPFIKQRHHELIVSLPPEPLFLQADAARLEQVVVNLLTNAAKYTDEGGCIWLSVDMQAAHEAGAAPTLVLKVRDNGIGIAPELLPRIFELFTQAERSLDRSQGGLGIGLSLVQKLVALHGGTIQAASVVGHGSEFIVQLPAMPGALPELQAADAPKPAPLAKSCRVLVVDDNQDAAQSLAMLLEMTGHKVSLAYDGPSAVEEASAFHPDVVLLDIGLPKLNGYEVAQQIRQQDALKHTVLVALTGYGLESDRKRSLAAGFDHHLVKPADFDEIENILAGIQ